MNRAIVKLADKYVTEIVRPKYNVSKSYKEERQEKIDLGDRITKTLNTEGWKDIENFIIQALNNTMLLMMEDTTKNLSQKDSHYIYKGYVAGYSWILRILGNILWAKRLAHRRIRVTQSVIDYLRGFMLALISIKDTVNGWLTTARRYKEEEE